jgi:hypothetical protein
MGQICGAFFNFFPSHDSYGGFMSKIAEANAKVHSLAMAVAVSIDLTIEPKLTNADL